MSCGLQICETRSIGGKLRHRFAVSASDFFRAADYFKVNDVGPSKVPASSIALIKSQKNRRQHGRVLALVNVRDLFLGVIFASGVFLTTGASVRSVACSCHQRLGIQVRASRWPSTI
jgi:hypothetical protein